MSDPSIHADIIKLIIGYTLTGAFVFTVIITCLSLIGIVKFADPAQQRRLFGVLVVELVVGCVGIYFGFLNVDPKKVQEQVQKPLVQQIKVVTEQKQVAEKDLAATRELVAAAGEDKVKLAATLANATQQVARLSAEKLAVERELQISRQQIATLAADNRAYQTKLGELNAMLRDVQAQKSEVESRLQLASQQVAKLTSEKEAIWGQFTQTTDSLKELQKSYAEALALVPKKERMRFQQVQAVTP
jgi:chromosome segregation ATPase